MPETMIQLCLHLGHLTTYLPIIMLGLYFHTRPIYAHALILVLFTTIYNLWLKSLFKMPLPATVGHEGWGLPSGHVHVSFIFWGWLALQLKPKWLKAICLTIIGLHSVAVVQAGFHFPVDVIAAIGFGSLTLGLYSYLLRKNIFQNTPALLGIFLSGITLGCIFALPADTVKNYLWQSQGALIGFSLGWLNLIQHNVTKPNDFRVPLTQLLIAVSGAVFINFLFLSSPMKQAFTTTFIQFFMTGGWLIICQRLFITEWKRRRN